jgi:hypothetical protein
MIGVATPIISSLPHHTAATQSTYKVLAGKYIDFKKTPAIFLFSESQDPNAFFSPVSEYQDRPKLDRSSDSRQDSVVYTPNPYETPIICVNRGLIDMVDNLDQLDYVLAHELTHFIIRNYGINGNSKGEEEIADLHAIDLMYDAGGDPKQSLIMADKISAYVKKKKDENRGHGRNAEEEGLNWSEIFNVHMTHTNRKSAIEASLTRISHLIDERTPSNIDKTVFNANYDDPIDAHLRDIDYAQKAPLEKLKALVDMVDIFSEDAPDETSIREQIDELGYETPEGFVSEEKLKILKLKQRRSDLWYSKGYFSGKVIEPKYKQKIACLSEEVFNDLYREQMEQNKLEPKKDEYEREFYPEDKLDTAPAIIYLQDKAYKHIKRHGYPDHGDMNYHDASSMLYSYFYNFFMSKMPRDKEEKYEDNAPAATPKVIDDINAVKLQIRNAQTKKELRKAIKKFKSLNKILNDFEELNDRERGGYHNKLENLSLFTRHSSFSFGISYEAQRIYSKEDKVPNGSVVTWNNLIKIAKDGKKAKKLVVQILKDNGIIDYRLTHDLPYVRMGDTTYKVNENGVLLPEKIESYELEFALHRDDVLAAYEYIKSYFEHENDYVQNICGEVSDLKEASFTERKMVDGYPSRLSNGQETTYALVEAFNSLPSDRDFSNRHVLSAIPSSYKRSNRMPACDKNGRLKITETLFEYTNPIFQKYFEENFQKTVQTQKHEQQEKLFETAFGVITQLPSMWINSSEKYIASNKEFIDFQNTFDGQQLNKEQEEHYNKLRLKTHFDRQLRESIYSVIVAYTFGVFESGHGRSDNISKITSEQKKHC